MQGGTTTTALGASLSWLALVFVGLVHAAGGDAPRSVEFVCGLLAVPIALAAAAGTMASFWRGPIIVDFTRGDSVPCSAAEATYIRAFARLRGLMGGAGHLYPRRLVFPALAWLAAAALGIEHGGSFEQAAGPWPLVATAVAACLAFFVPARPFFYRETTGGGVILSPPSAAYRLKARAELASARARGVDVGSETPAPTPAPDPRSRMSVSRAASGEPQD